MNAKFGVTVIAAILVGVAVLSFVSYVAFDAVGYGKITENGEPYAPTWGTNQTITLRFSPVAQPVVTFWDAAGAVNGTVPTTNLTWNSGNQIEVYHWNWTLDNPTGCPYGKDTTYLRFNYTSQGAAARAITQPAIVLCGVFAIVIVAGVMIAGTGRLGGKGGGRKRFP